MAKLIEVTPETVARAKKLYCESDLPVGEIAAMLGLSYRTLHKRIDLWGWARRRGRIAKVDAAAREAMAAFASEAGACVPLPAVAASDDRRSTAAKLRAALEREISAVETALLRIDAVTLRAGDRERAARTLASLVKTLNELNKLDAGTKGEQDGREPAGRLGELRRELAARLERLGGGGAE